MKWIAPSVMLLVSLPAVMLSQGERGAITGVVRDTTGAVVPAARVSVVDLATNVERTTTTTDTGVYRIPYLSPGNYRVTASAAGFKTAVISPTVVTVAGVVTADFVLNVGDTSESVTVSADATLLESSSSEIGRSISSSDYHTLPVYRAGGGGRRSRISSTRPCPEPSAAPTRAPSTAASTSAMKC